MFYFEMPLKKPGPGPKDESSHTTQFHTMLTYGGARPQVSFRKSKGEDSSVPKYLEICRGSSLGLTMYCEADRTQYSRWDTVYGHPGERHSWRREHLRPGLFGAAMQTKHRLGVKRKKKKPESISSIIESTCLHSLMSCGCSLSTCWVND